MGPWGKDEGSSLLCTGKVVWIDSWPIELVYSWNGLPSIEMIECPANHEIRQFKIE